MSGAWLYAGVDWGVRSWVQGSGSEKGVDNGKKSESHGLLPFFEKCVGRVKGERSAPFFLFSFFPFFLYFLKQTPTTKSTCYFRGEFSRRKLESATGPVRVLKTKSRENKRQLHKSLQLPCNFQEEHPHSIYMYLYVSTHTHTLYQHYVYPPHMDTHSHSHPLPLSLSLFLSLSTAHSQTPIQPPTPTSHTPHADLMEHYAGGKR